MKANFKLVLKNLGLVIVAMGIAFIVCPLSFVLRVVFFKGRSKFLYKTAITIDQGGNSVAELFWKWTLVKGPSEFGDPGQRISFIMYQHRNNLTLFGKALYKTIDRLDKNHFEKAHNEYLEKIQELYTKYIHKNTQSCDTY